MYSAYKLNKQGDNIQPWHTPLHIHKWYRSISILPYMCMYIYILEQEKNYCYFNSDYFWEIGVKVIFKIFFFILYNMGFPGGSVVKNPPANAGDIRDACLIPGSGRFPGVGNSSPIQYSCLENSMDREAWWATVHGTAGSDTTAWLRTHSEQHKYYFPKIRQKGISTKIIHHFH